MTNPKTSTRRATIDLDADRDADRDVERSETTVTDRQGTPDHVHPLPAQPQPNVNVPTPRRDQVRWSAVWAGVVVAVAVFLLLELAAFWAGLLTPGNNDAGIGRAVTSGIIGLIAFFVGGMTAGSAAMWNGVRSGILHGVMVWALGLVSVLLLALLGGGALLGTVANVLNDTTAVLRAPADADVSGLVTTARSAAADAVLGLGLAIIASVLGGLVGTKMWNGREDDAVTSR